ncbi:hypothetical protein EVAR_103883_1 [Eumeta japonica]|uniref:Uncharacterized protein n=1 Tax=Eumeta variegata TaxID=151549 RepID=A0A4C1ZLJ9_EUMVA|nr:hypothetical protein EVAR_103883_1 [Eumeta japonica]
MSSLIKHITQRIFHTNLFLTVRREALCTARPWAVAHTAHGLRRLCVVEGQIRGSAVDLMLHPSPKPTPEGARADRDAAARDWTRSGRVDVDEGEN